MDIISTSGKHNVATVYVAKTGSGKIIEFVESIQPPIPRHKKWVIIVSTLYGCPVGCAICDAGNFYDGKLSKKEMIEQIDFLVIKRFKSRHVPVSKFKIQFARMGEPSFNMNVLDVLEELPKIYNAPGLMPSVSTVAPQGTDKFFEKLAEIKNDLYKERFQFQFSIHTTDIELRDIIIPVKKWDFSKIARYGEKFYNPSERKITLNFALEQNAPIDPEVLLSYFNPNIFLIKITPINPTYRAKLSNQISYIDSYKENNAYEIVDSLRNSGYEVLLSIGENVENHIGSNCGQYVTKHINSDLKLSDGYTFNYK